MKTLSILILFCSVVSFKATAQDTIQYKDLPAYVGRKVKVVMHVIGFDLRKEYIYLYMGNFYPDQELTIIVKRYNGKKRIRLNKDIILGQVAVSLTGYIAFYDEGPDTTKSYNDPGINKAFEKVHSGNFIGLNTPFKWHRRYTPRTEPIDLRGKLMMLITQQKQIGATYRPPSSNINFNNLPPIWADDRFNDNTP
jgi:hypothetical protein